MNWDAIGAGAELLGALGVIASLIYLALQIRQNTESVRMASHRGIADQFQQTNLAVMQDPEVSDLLMRGLPDASSLSDLERFRFELFLMALFRTYEELYQLNQKGLIDPDLWACREQAMVHWLSHESVRSWWNNEQRVAFIASFHERVEYCLSELVAEPPADSGRSR